jgi:hypothetical protein
LHPT